MMRKMTGPERAGAGILGGALVLRVASFVLGLALDYRSAMKCPHPEHRIYAETMFHCAECGYPVEPVS